ncbi:hypothetical protein WA556_002414, partial [Blastocystis sp. ATCC 50177/Nand II]
MSTQREPSHQEELYSQGRRMMEYMNLADNLTEEQHKQLEELRPLVPEGTSDSKLQGMIISCKGDKAKLSILVSNLWNSCEASDDGWEEVTGRNKPHKNQDREKETHDAAETVSAPSKPYVPKTVRSNPINSRRPQTGSRPSRPYDHNSDNRPQNKRPLHSYQPGHLPQSRSAPAAPAAPVVTPKPIPKPAVPAVTPAAPAAPAA